MFVVADGEKIYLVQIIHPRTVAQILEAEREMKRFLIDLYFNSIATKLASYKAGKLQSWLAIVTI